MNEEMHIRSYIIAAYIALQPPRRREYTPCQCNICRECKVRKHKQAYNARKREVRREG